MGILRSIFGDLRWTPPEWLRKLGAKRALIGVGLIAIVSTLALAAVRYYDALPKPTHVVAEVVVPGITPIVNDELRPLPLTINFSVEADPRTLLETVESVARIDLVNEELTEGVSIEPAVPGSWRWSNETSLEFRPSEDWPAGQEYTVHFDKSLFSPNLILASDRAEFVTLGFSAALDEFIFYQDPVEQSVRKGVATLSFSHPVDSESLNQHLSYKMRNPGATVIESAKPVDYEVTFDKNHRKAFVHSTPITIPPQETYLTIHLTEQLEPAMGPSRFAEEIVQNVRIPDVASYFRVSNVQSITTRNDDDEPEQTLTLEFTDRVRTDALQAKLSAYVLPTNLTLDGQRVNNKHWRTAREVTAEVLGQAEQIDIQLNPSEGDSAQLHSARLDVPEQSYIYLQIEDGLKSDGDFLLSVRSDNLVTAPSYPKEAKIAQSGALLPLTSSQKLTFLSRGVKTLRVEVGRLIDSELNHLASQSHGDMQNPYFSNYMFNEDNMTARSTRFIELSPDHPKKAVYSNLDLSEYLPDGGYYFVTVQGWDRQRDRAVGSLDKRFILITDLGLLVKTNNDSTQDIFVHSIESGQPIQGATVQLLGKNGVPIIERTTAFDGHAKMPATNTFEREKSPTVFVVRNGQDSVFMPYARGGRMLQYSRFDVGGDYVRRRAEGERLKAQLFSDRGLYRPGDTAKVAAIVKRDDWSSLGNLPLVLSIVDPRGQVVMDKRLGLPDDGFFDEAFVTEAASPTGNYNATLYLIEERQRRRAIGSVTIKVEEFLPDRLRIRSSITGQKPHGWVKPGELACEVSLENLFGTAAESRRVTGELNLQPSGIRLGQYPGYIFDDPLRDLSSSVQQVTLPLTPTSTNQDGLASLPLDLRQYDKGIYRLSVSTEGFEEGGGRSVKAQVSVMMSPLDYLIGHKADGDLSFVDKSSARSVEFLAVNSDAAPLALNDLTLSIVEEEYVSTLVKRPNGTFAYQSVLKEKPVSTQPYSVDEEGSSFDLQTDEPGTFVVKISDQDDLVYSKVRYTVAGARNLTGNLERDAELDLVLNGKSFNPGEEIEMEITAPYNGTGLITIERDRVYAYKWFHSDSNTSVQTIRVPADLEGNAYVNVAFVRDLESPEIFVSPLSYGVQPIEISRDARTVKIDLDVPDIVKPGEELTVSYRSTKSARVVIYAVDEGILQVAKYEMPNPLGFFLRKMALQVSTFQIADLILPDFDAYQSSAAPGGGEGVGLAGQNLNPFRRKSEAPVAFWSGIVESGSEQRTVSFDVPDYFSGQLRVMAVAVSEQAVGQTNTATIARGPFVITPSALTAAAPGDEFEVSVGLSNNLEGSGENALIELAVSTSEHLEIVGERRLELRIDEGRESRATIRVRALNALGSARIDFEAKSGSEVARRKATLSVRPSVAYVATMVAGAGDDDPLALQFDRTLYDQLANQSVAASASPLILTDGLLSYLEAFPHACAEQIVSKVFPQIGFLGRGDYAVDESAIREQFNATVTKLRSRQNPQGGFHFWATSREPAEFPSVYILHFLTDAKALGLSVPRDMLASGLDYLRQIAAREVNSLAQARLRAYAIYVLTRNATITTNYLTNLHEYLDSQHTDKWRGDLAAAYMASSYELLKKSQLGSQLIGDYEIGAGNEMVSDFDTRLGRDAQYIYLLARHFPNQVGDIDASSIQNLAAPIMQNRFNTLSSAYAVLALGEYTNAVMEASGGPMLSISDASGDATKLLAEAAVFSRTQVDNSVSRLQVNGSKGADIYYVLSQTGFDTTPPSEAVSNGLEISRDYLNDKDEPVSAAQIGDELTVRLRVRSTGAVRSNVAVVDMLPGGFEVLTETMRDQYGTWNVDYKDIREDRVVIYGTFADRISEIRYRVKVTSAGDFVVPAAYAGSMYDRSIQSNTKPGRFQVQSVR